ncbi:MAG: hypothetical protein ACK56W_10395 [Pirellula sp.]|jgi:hypothetical protein|nr:hypothetical protein [Pirellula sp.]
MKTLGKIEVSELWRGKGNCRHVRNGVEVTQEVVFLHVAQLDGDIGFYLFYEGKDGNELNDLSFDTLDELFRQVEHEFAPEVAELLRATCKDKSD